MQYCYKTHLQCKCTDRSIKAGKQPYPCKCNLTIRKYNLYVMYLSIQYIFAYSNELWVGFSRKIFLNKKCNLEIYYLLFFNFNITSYPFILLFYLVSSCSLSNPTKGHSGDLATVGGYQHPSGWHTPCHIAWEQRSNLQPIPPSYVADSFGPAQQFFW